MNRPYLVMLGDIIFPITPGQITLAYPSTGEIIRLTDGTQINKTKPSGLCVYKMKVMLPKYDYPFASREAKSQDYYLRTIHSMYKNREFVSLIIWRTNADGSMNMGEEDIVVSGDGIVTGKSVTIDNYTVIEDAENGFDIWIELELREYVGYGSRRFVSENTGKSTLTQEKTSEIPLTYIAKEGDTLGTICKAIFGKSEKWSEIARLNNLSKNLLEIGTIIKLRE